MATEYVKRVGTVGRKDLEETAIVQALLSLFVGGVNGASAAAWSLREKILEQLLHSRLVSTMAPWCVKLTFESLFGPGTSPRVQCSGCEFAKRFVECSEMAILEPVKALMLQALSKTLRQTISSGNNNDAVSGNPATLVRLTSLSSAGLVQLASRSPSLFGADLELPNMMFDLLVSSRNELRASAQEALSSLVEAYVVSSPPHILATLRTQLLTRATQDDYRVRLCALTWLGKLYPFEDPAVRHTCMDLSSDPRQEVRKLAEIGLKLKLKSESLSADSTDTTERKVSGLLKNLNSSQQFRRGTPPSTSTMVRFLMSKPTISHTRTRAEMLNAVSMTRTLEFVQKCLLYQVEETKEDVPEEAVLMCADLVSLAIGSDVSQIGATQLLRVAASSLAKLVELFPDVVGKRYASDENVKRLETWLSEPNQDLREGASRVLLLVAQWIEESALRALLERMLFVTLDRVEQDNAKS